MSSNPTVRPHGGSVAEVRATNTDASAERLPLDFNAMLSRIRAEFFEMPGLRLTEAQARRLWSLDRRTCEVLLAVLVDAKLLAWQPDGRVMKAEGEDATSYQGGSVMNKKRRK
jgi:hypothetical protein